MLKLIIKSIILTLISINLALAYSASQDETLIAEYKRQLHTENLQYGNKYAILKLDHAHVARDLVTQSTWASVATISTNKTIQDYPMVNIISINDKDANGRSTGHIQFLLTDLDFTGSDWRNNNKTTFMISAKQSKQCDATYFEPSKDPMDPTCARVILSGHIHKLDKNSVDYDGAIVAFVERHPAAKNWLKAHSFYLCELLITNIFVVDSYDGPQNVSVDDYYRSL